jgi:hypothetical protein
VKADIAFKGAHDYPEESDIQASLLNKAFSLSERRVIVKSGVRTSGCVPV